MRKGRKTYAWGKPTMAVSTMCIKRGSDSPTWSILIIITNQLHSKTLTAAAGAFALPTRSQPAKLQQPNGTKDPQNQLTWASIATVLAVTGLVAAQHYTVMVKNINTLTVK